MVYTLFDLLLASIKLVSDLAVDNSLSTCRLHRAVLEQNKQSVRSFFYWKLSVTLFARLPWTTKTSVLKFNLKSILIFSILFLESDCKPVSLRTLLSDFWTFKRRKATFDWIRIEQWTLKLGYKLSCGLVAILGTERVPVNHQMPWLPYNFLWSQYMVSLFSANWPQIFLWFSWSSYDLFERCLEI